MSAEITKKITDLIDQLDLRVMTYQEIRDWLERMRSLTSEIKR